MEKYLPYIVSIICAVISGIASYSVARKQGKADLQKLEKQHKLDLDKQREVFEMEKEKMELEHKHRIELMEKETENALGTELISTLAKEYMHTPEGQAQIRSAGKNRRR